MQMEGKMRTICGTILAVAAVAVGAGAECAEKAADFALVKGGQAVAALSGRDGMEVSVYGNSDRAVLVSRFDNLGKGASGAAIQNMNIVLGCAEDEGLVR